MKLTKLVLCLVVLLHYVTFLSFVLTCLISFLFIPWFVAITLIALVIRVIFSPDECPLTTLENVFRKKLNLKPSKGFLKDYILHIKDTLKYLINN
mgnify:CR=1 FL=1|tara:strand:- start:1952 stop:2236 length:285 start_codon:yes stop_codon:yes gene_type:complete